MMISKAKNILFATAAGILLGGFFFITRNNRLNDLIYSNLQTMVISSQAFMPDQPIPAKYTCDDLGVHPPLKFNMVPPETKSLALIVDDPDAVSGTFIHWTVWNIDPKNKSIDEGQVPLGAVEGLTSLSKPGYVPPCPPNGTHRYYFKLFALDTILNLSPESTVDEMRAAMAGHVISDSELVGIHTR